MTEAMIDFILSCILMNETSGQDKLKHYAMLVHIEATKKSHTKQKEIFEEIKNLLIEKIKQQDTSLFKQLEKHFIALLDGMEVKIIVFL